ncbi:M23 family metallopeptidase [Marinicella meishanensis]|uniref:M23 family metallopeptidase n=1 Tax=Marinicella meishanensis TaxID=2873263 RepID=UPI0032AEB7AE
MFNKLNPMIIFFALASSSVLAQGPLVWPLNHEIHNKTYISNYMDQNPTSNFFRDHSCGTTHGYDGHHGTDMAVNSFRDSDQEVGVVAAQSGVVTSATSNQPDRNFWPPYDGTGNGVWIRHDDGQYALYWHMRKDSITVQVGDRVEQGQLLGYVASSGNTPIPHLHFQVNNSQNFSDAVDPFAGNCNPHEGLWENQIDYVSDDPLRVLDAGVTLEMGFQGVYQFGPLVPLKERLIQPVGIASDEAMIAIWAQFQGNVGDQLTMIVLDPSGDRFYTSNYTLSTKRRYGWYVDAVPFMVNEEAAKGVWTLLIENDQGSQYQQHFVVQETTQYAPRFYPVSGKSFVINGAAQTHQLVELGLSGNLRYQLIGAPSEFKLNGQVLTVPPVSSQQYRNLNFSIAAIDEEGYIDYFKVHVVDYDKPNNDFIITDAINGNWFNPISGGRGFNIEVSHLFFMTWFTFQSKQTGSSAAINNTVGHTDQRWLAASGDFSGNKARLDILNVKSGFFDQANQVEVSEPASYGTIEIEFYDCNFGLVKYDIFAENLSGSIPIQKIVGKPCE